MEKETIGPLGLFAKEGLLFGLLVEEERVGFLSVAFIKLLQFSIDEGIKWSLGLLHLWLQMDSFPEMARSINPLQQLYFFSKLQHNF